MLGRSDLALAALRQLGAWLAARPARGPLEVSEAGLVARIARFTAKTARDVLVPHVDVCAVPDTAPVAEVVALVQERGFSRLPVFHERMFNTLGVVSSLDLLGEMDPHLPVTAVMREPLFVPESKPLPELLSTLQAEGRNLALVVDEYGGFVGLVTVEDVVEEIVGEIQDEYDLPQEHVRRVAPGVFVVNALVRLRGMPFEDLGFAKLDHHRALRNGFPEVILGEGKSPEQVIAIAERMAAAGGSVLVTLLAPEVAERLVAAVPGFEYHATPRLARRRAGSTTPAGRGTVLVVSAGTADLPVAEEAALP